MRKKIALIVIPVKKLQRIFGLKLASEVVTPASLVATIRRLSWAETMPSKKFLKKIIGL